MSAALLAAHEAASFKLKDNKGGQLSTRRGIESNYGATYQALVRAGLKPQLRKKYR